MRWRTLPIEILLLVFLGLFLIYPLVYVIPNSASDSDYRVVLLDFPADAKQRSGLLELLTKSNPSMTDIAMRMPYTVQTFPGARKVQADTLAAQLAKNGAKVQVVQDRHW